MSGDISLGTLIAFENYVLMLVFPMLDLGNFVVRGRQGSTCIGRLLELESEPPAVLSPASPVALHSGPVALELHGVSVGHGVGEARRVVLRDVSFAVRPGEMVAIVGRIGAGKTSLLRLPPRLVDPHAGRVTLGGADLRDLALSDLRLAVGVAFQERTLFSGTVRENVRFWREHVTEDDVQWATGVARLGADLSGFTQGLETTVGVRGVTLSGGQAQRVALARALAGRPRARAGRHHVGARCGDRGAVVVGTLARPAGGGDPRRHASPGDARARASHRRARRRSRRGDGLPS